MIISAFNRLENIVGKGENVGYQHFVLLPQSFKKASFQDMSNGVTVWEWVKALPHDNLIVMLLKSAFYPLFFSTMFSNTLSVRVLKTQDCIVQR